MAAFTKQDELASLRRREGVRQLLRVASAARETQRVPDGHSGGVRGATAVLEHPKATAWRVRKPRGRMAFATEEAYLQ